MNYKILFSIIKNRKGGFAKSQSLWLKQIRHYFLTFYTASFKIGLYRGHGKYNVPGD